MRSKKALTIVALVVVVALGVIAAVILFAARTKPITNFEECAAAGYPILDSYPEQCMTPDGKRFVKSRDVGESVIYLGKLVCLPHKDTGGPTTLECAYGLQTTDGLYHALIDEDGNVTRFPIDTLVEVRGTILPTNADERYDIQDRVEVDSIEKSIPDRAN